MPLCLYISRYNYTHVLRDMAHWDIGHTEGSMFPFGSFIPSEKGKKMWTEAGNRKATVKHIVLKLWFFWELHQNPFSDHVVQPNCISHKCIWLCFLTALFWYAKNILSWGCQSKLKEVFLTWNCLIPCFKGQSSFCETMLVEERESI